MDDEPTGSPDTTLSVNIGSSITGEIESEGDVDFIAVELEAGVAYQIDLEGSRTGQGTLIDPFLTGIFDSNGNSVADENDDGGLVTNSRIIFTPSESGTYYIGASHYDNTDLTDIGTYTLYVDEEALSTRMDPVVLAASVTSGNDLIDGLLTSLHYGPDEDDITRLTYSFTDETSTFYEEFDLDDGGPNLTETVVAPSAEAIAHYESGLAFVSSITNIEFTRVEESDGFFGNLRLSGNTADTREDDGTVLGIAAFPSRNLTAGDIYLFEDVISDASLVFVTLHELGHALGLAHFYGDYPEEFEGVEFSLLTPSFTSIFYTDATRADLYPTTYSYADILALRHHYGETTDVNAGDTVYSFDVSERYWETIFDLGGTDTLEIISDGEAVAIDLTPNDEFFGGAFIDVGTTVTFYDGSVELGSREETVFVSPETVIENVIVGDGDDSVIANSADNRLEGGDGNDTLNGAAGDDRIIGEAGNDVLLGGTGNDFQTGGEGNDTAAGGAGDDAIFAGTTDTGNDLLLGGDGNDTLGGGAGDDLLIGGSHSGSLTTITGDSGDLSFDNSDTLFGGDGNDTLLGGAFNDQNENGSFDTGDAYLNHSAGNTIYAGAGDDLAFGANGDDVLGGGEGDDTLWGGDGSDILYGGPQDEGTSGLNDYLYGGAGDDTIYASYANDRIFGENGNDLIFGGDGNDTIRGGFGDDEIYDSAGNDRVFAGSGDDTLWGVAGNDTVTGDNGADIFIFHDDHGADVITDFDLDEDLLNLENILIGFTDLASVISATEETTQGSETGILITTGEESSIFLRGLSLDDLNQMNIVL